MNYRIVLSEHIGNCGGLRINLTAEIDGQIYRSSKGFYKDEEEFSVNNKKKKIIGSLFTEIGEFLNHE